MNFFKACGLKIKVVLQRIYSRLIYIILFGILGNGIEDFLQENFRYETEEIFYNTLVCWTLPFLSGRDYLSLTFWNIFVISC